MTCEERLGQIGFGYKLDQVAPLKKQEHIVKEYTAKSGNYCIQTARWLFIIKQDGQIIVKDLVKDCWHSEKRQAASQKAGVEFVQGMYVSNHPGVEAARLPDDFVIFE